MNYFAEHDILTCKVRRSVRETVNPRGEIVDGVFKGLYRCHMCYDPFDSVPELKSHLQAHASYVLAKKEHKSNDQASSVSRLPYAPTRSSFPPLLPKPMHPAGFVCPAVQPVRDLSHTPMIRIVSSFSSSGLGEKEQNVGLKQHTCLSCGVALTLEELFVHIKNFHEDPRANVPRRPDHGDGEQAYAPAVKLEANEAEPISNSLDIQTTSVNRKTSAETLSSGATSATMASVLERLRSSGVSVTAFSNNLPNNIWDQDPGVGKDEKRTKLESETSGKEYVVNGNYMVGPSSSQY